MPLDVQLSERLSQDLHLGYTRIGSHRADVHVHWRSEEEYSATSGDSTYDHIINAYADALSDNSDVLPPTATKVKRPALKEQAANVLSRGEKKLLITALRLSQLPLLLSESALNDAVQAPNRIKATPVVLLDDITAELDDRAIDILLSTLAKLPCQVFMTSLTQDIVPLVNQYWSSSNLFHVKQGIILPFS